MLDWLIGANLGTLGVVIIVVVTGASELGTRIGLRMRAAGANNTEFGTMTGAVLGLVALLLAFSFSLALSRYDGRRNWVLEEANAIGSTANFALMLPEAEQKPVLDLLRQYTDLRINLGVPFEAAKMEQNIAQSLQLQSKLWQQAMAATAAAPQSLPVFRFVGSLNEMNNIHERRVTALRNHVPFEVMLILIGVAMVGMGFTGYSAGVAGSHHRSANLILSVTLAVLILLIVDLDRPTRGLIQVPVQALIDAANGIPR